MSSHRAKITTHPGPFTWTAASTRRPPLTARCSHGLFTRRIVTCVQSSSYMDSRSTSCACSDQQKTILLCNVRSMSFIIATHLYSCPGTHHPHQPKQQSSAANSGFTPSTTTTITTLTSYCSIATRQQLQSTTSFSPHTASTLQAIQSTLIPLHHDQHHNRSQFRQRRHENEQELADHPRR